MSLPMKSPLFEVTTLDNGQCYLAPGKKLPCINLELNYAECLEAYGVHMGAEKCRKFGEDLQECQVGKLREMRTTLMNIERSRQVLKGERKLSERWGTPYPVDSFAAGTYFP